VSAPVPAMPKLVFQPWRRWESPPSPAAPGALGGAIRGNRGHNDKPLGSAARDDSFRPLVCAEPGGCYT
jgi:hypothetical protein